LTAPLPLTYPLPRPTCRSTVTSPSLSTAPLRLSRNPAPRGAGFLDSLNGAVDKLGEVTVDRQVGLGSG